MPARRIRRLFFYSALLGVCAVILVAATRGDDGVRRVPVSGVVTLDGRPFEPAGPIVLQFNPDLSKGNTARVVCSGRVSRGRFTLATSGVLSRDAGPGAPLGWYRVVMRDARDRGPDGKEPSETNVHPRYYQEEETTLSVEIVENPQPGQYTIKLTSE